MRFGFCLGPIGPVPDRGHHGEGQHDERDVLAPSAPGAGLVMTQSQLVFAVSKLSSMAQRQPSTRMSVSMEVPAGAQVEKKTKSPSAIVRRINRPHVQSPGQSAPYTGSGASLQGRTSQ